MPQRVSGCKQFDGPNRHVTVPKGLSCLTDRNTITNHTWDLQQGSICPRYSRRLYHSYIELAAVLGFLTSGSSVTESEIGPGPRAACISLHSSSAASHFVLLPLLEASPGPSEL